MSWGKVRIDPADRLFSIYVRLRDGCCQRCMKAGTGRLGIDGLQASHFQGRHYHFQVQRLGEELVERIVLLSNSYSKKDRAGQKLYWSLRLKQEYPNVIL